MSQLLYKWCGISDDYRHQEKGRQNTIPENDVQLRLTPLAKVFYTEDFENLTGQWLSLDTEILRKRCRRDTVKFC